VILSGTLTTIPGRSDAGKGATGAAFLADLYRRHGLRALSEIDGSFAATIIDWRNNTVVLARDKLGIARAYLCLDHDRVIFSDSLGHLLENLPTRPELDLDSVYAFLAIGWVPTPYSMFRGIEKLPAGTCVIAGNCDVKRYIYYDVPHSASELRSRSKKELDSCIADGLERSVRRGLAIGGAWGSFLSGGVDSSSVVATMGKVIQRPFPTYFGGFAPELNKYLPNPEEPKMARAVALHVATNHRSLLLEPSAIENSLDVVGALEEPVCDGGSIVLAEVMRTARNETDGLMTGIGGDYLFTGERRHAVLNLLRIMKWLPNSVWQSLNRCLALRAWSGSARISQAHFDLSRVLKVQDVSLEEMYIQFFLQADVRELHALFLPETHAAITRDPTREIYNDFRVAADLDPLGQFLYLDLKHQMTEHVVREAETLGRRFGLDVYNPFLDAELVNFAMSIPSEEKVCGLTLKVPLKRAMRGRVPPQVLNRKKGGLGSPIRWWVTKSDGLVRQVLSPANIEHRGCFSAHTIEQYRVATASGMRDYSKLLWSLFTLELWMQQFIDGWSRMRDSTVYDRVVLTSPTWSMTSKPYAAAAETGA
jgi:asparagine synthase (glutamine-hydrolysing)